MDDSKDVKKLLNRGYKSNDSVFLSAPDDDLEKFSVPPLTLVSTPLVPPGFTVLDGNVGAK